MRHGYVTPRRTNLSRYQPYRDVPDALFSPRHPTCTYW